MPSLVSHVATAKETAADCSKAQPAMMPTPPMAPAKKGIPKAPTSSASSSAPPASSRLQRVARITTRLPAAPAGGDVGRNCDDMAALQQPSTAIPCPPPSSSTAGLQQPVEEQPCDCSGDEGPAATTSDACASSDLLRSASSSSCGNCPSSSLSASSSCSRSSLSSSSAVATDSEACLVSSASDSLAASSSAERPTSLPSNQAEQEANTDSEDTEPPCCCPTTSTSIATTPDTATATATATTTTSTTTSTTTTSPSRVRFFVAAPNDPNPPSKFALSPAEARQMIDKLTEMYGNYNIRLLDALLAAPPREICAPVTAPASPRLSPTAESEEEEASPAAPSEGTAQPSKAPKRKLSKFLRGLFGGCVGRNVEAL
ncbi:hypothetical protein PLESTB_000872400 [Pleodorina starrii]|uniref:Uncharacterized protein n=1 Tax=Pleodorina starrii TaxID=330485 RepID=A0A9W6BMI6_9CHLO|nr:hypothetical protein PLESTM_001750700 [Pleodorina starrii]GLC54490.1 hypothetical protein PLESTB_000872400 [Pleodorina starrii]